MSPSSNTLLQTIPCVEFEDKKQPHWVLRDPGQILTEAPLGMPASPIGLVGGSSSSLPSVPPRQGDHTGYFQGQYGSDSTYLPMHVRPSACRAYFWWQPHMGPVSVSSQLC